MCVPITINTRVCEHISNGKLPGVLCTADLFCIGNLKSSSAIYLPVFNHFKICRLQHWQTRTILCPAFISGCWKRPKSGEKNNHSGSGVGLCASPSCGAHPTAQLQEEMGKVAHQPATAPKEKIQKVCPWKKQWSAVYYKKKKTLKLGFTVLLCSLYLLPCQCLLMHVFYATESLIIYNSYSFFS